MKVGVIGVGVVGGATLKAFQDRGLDAIGYDKFNDSHGTFEPMLQADVVFLCVPTATNPDGTQNYEPLEDVFGRLKEANFSGVIVVKSTVTPGTTERLATQFGFLEQTCHNPEFLTAARPYEDFMNQHAILIGGGSEASRGMVQAVYLKAGFNGFELFPHAKMSEFAKYLHNIFLSIKVGFMNEFYDWVHTEGMDYGKIKNAAVLMGGVGPGHTSVPGPDGLGRGFGGMCFVKDTEAIKHWAQSKGLPVNMLQACIEANRVRRPNAYNGVEKTGYQD